MTVEEITGAIKLHLAAALGTEKVIHITEALIEDELRNTRAAMIKELKMSEFVSIEPELMQTIIVDAVQDTQFGQKVRVVQIPSFIVCPAFEPFSYIGTEDGMVDLKYYLNKDHRYHKYRYYTGKRPYIFVDLKQGFEQATGILYQYDKDKLLVRAVFEDPYVEGYAGKQIQNIRYPMPDSMVQSLIDTVVNKYVQEYRSANNVGYPVFHKT